MLVALPYLCYDVVMQTLNLIVNVFFNHLWGPMNWILIFNTCVSLFQGLTSFLLVAEFPIYMRRMHVVRGFSFFLGLIYNFFYIWGIAEYWHGTYEAHKDGELYTGLFMFIDLFVIWHLAFYFPIFFINMIIVLRELKFEFFSKNRQHFYGGTYDELKLGFGDMWHSYLSVLNLFNPLWWLGRFFKHGDRDYAEMEYLETELADDDVQYIHSHGEMPDGYQDRIQYHTPHEDKH